MEVGYTLHTALNPVRIICSFFRLVFFHTLFFVKFDQDLQPSTFTSTKNALFLLTLKLKCFLLGPVRSAFIHDRNGIALYIFTLFGCRHFYFAFYQRRFFLVHFVHIDRLVWGDTTIGQWALFVNMSMYTAFFHHDIEFEREKWIRFYLESKIGTDPDCKAVIFKITQ